MSVIKAEKQQYIDYIKMMTTGFRLVSDLSDEQIGRFVDEALNQLQPYIDDTFITPLQCKTGEKFKTADEWVKWYNADNQKKYPKCKEDIEYCKMIANYLK